MKRICTVLLIMLVSHVILGQNHLYDIARNGIKTYWKHIPHEMKNKYGFEITESIDNVYLEEPLNLYKITPIAIENYQQGDSVKSLLSMTNLWYFPLSVNNIIRSILVIDKIENEFKAVSIGYANLARAINTLKNKWTSSTGYRFKLVVVYQAKSFLYTIPELNNYNLTLIELTDASLLENAADVSDKTNLENLSITIWNLMSIIQNQGD